MESMKPVLKPLMAVVIFCFFSITIAVTCSQNNKPPEDAPLTVTAEIGPEGGILSGPMGSQVLIPPGALTDTESITLTLYRGNDSLPGSWCPVPGLEGVINLGPDGLTFLIPVTITIPLNNHMVPNEIIPLLYWNAIAKKWDQTAISATVSSDGTLLTAQVDHFSAYGGASFHNFASGGSADRFMAEFAAWYQNNIARLEQKKLKYENCYEVVGIDFDLTYNINGDEGQKFLRLGTSQCDHAGAPLVMINYNYDISDGQSYNAVINMTTTEYYDCAEPEMSLQADPPTVAEGNDSTVRATLRCGQEIMPGKEINFTVEAGPGEVNPGLISTNSSGIATTTFTAGNEDGTVKGEYTSTCETEIDAWATQVIHVSPDTFSLYISFQQETLADDFTDSFSYSGTVSIDVTSYNQDGSANLSGSNTFNCSGSGSGGDCTSTTTGNVTYTVTGSITFPETGTPQMNLTVTPNFNTIKTIYCPDDPPLSFPYLTGGETYSFTIPMQNGYEIISDGGSGPITNRMIYRLTF